MAIIKYDSLNFKKIWENGLLNGHTPNNIVLKTAM